MFSSRAPIGYVAINAVDAATNQGFKSLVPCPAVFNEFLYYYFKASKQLAEERATGTTFKEISGSAFSMLPVPLAPLPEQHRIVAKIEELFSELDASVESLTRARAQLKTYRQALLKAAFEGKLTADWRAANSQELERPEALLARICAEREARYACALEDWQVALSEWRAGGEVGERPSKPRAPEKISPENVETEFLPDTPDSWATCFLGDLNVDISDGPFGSNLKSSDYVDQGVRVVRLENIGYGYFVESKRSFISEEKYEIIKKHTVAPGDIVFSSFITDAVRSAIIPSSVPFAVNKADCFAIKTFGTRVRTNFIQLYLECRNAFKQLEGMIHGVGRPRINTTQLKELSVPVCSPEEQDRIVECLEPVLSELEAIGADIEVCLAQIYALRQSILKKAFSGQLVTQDPADEPASVLLARFREQAPASKTRRKKSA